ncbi:MAG: hypothetical protein NC342_06465 [Pseudoflavonifractor sp.]|nr:hypothetical protein [Alloprevotella sp.]MCM1117162.1 hypothetical protein [Pseudoflavonifractor sp.]
MNSAIRHIATAIALALISLILPQAVDAQETFKRGLEHITFIPKGQWITGVSVNYTQSHQDNYQFLIVENLSGDTYSFKVSPMLFYSFKDNLAGGGRFSYERSMTDLDRGNVIIDSETSYDFDNLHQLSSNYFVTGALRYYISMGNSTRFGLFNELQLKLGGGQSKIVNGLGDDLTGTFERNFQASVGLSPGLIMFLSNYSAIEVNVGVLGFGYTHTKATTDRVFVSNRKSHHANFKVNLFSISFGVAFYL